MMAEWNNNEKNSEETTIDITTYYSTITQTNCILHYTAVKGHCHKKTGCTVMTQECSICCRKKLGLAAHFPYLVMLMLPHTSVAMVVDTKYFKNAKTI